MIQILTIRDYNDIEHPLLAVKTHTSELNGSDTLDLKIAQQKNNNLDLLSIDKLWEIEYNNIDYKITRIKKQTRGKSFDLNVGATPLFFWEFSKSIIHENHDGSHTANSAFRIVFEGTGFNFVLVDFSPAVSWEGFGKGSTRLEMFKRLIDRYNYEFEIFGKTVYMRHRIGNDTNFMYKYKLNASNVSSTTDANGYFTYIRGFGDFEEGEEDYLNNAKLKPEPYISPLAEVVGLWEGKPIVDGRISVKETMEARMKEAVEKSLEITVEGTLHDVRKMGYETAVPVKGDRVWLHDERIDLEQEIRLHKIVTVYDEKDEVIDCNVTFGSQSIGERHKANINSLSKRFADLLTGQLKLPVISLEKIGMDMINAIHAASSEIIFGDFGMQAISKTNPNHVFGLNSEGWYISQDGGRTPRTIATAQGIYADAIFAGTLWLTNDLNIEGVDGYLNIASQLISMKNHDGSNSTIIEPGRLRMNRSDFELGGGADIHLLDAANRMYYQHPDTQTGQMRSAGTGYGININDRFPYTYLGASDSTRPHAMDDYNFTGFIANTLERANVDGIGNSSVGPIFHVRNKAVAFNEGWIFDMTRFETFFGPINTGLHDYDLGRSGGRWNNAYFKNEPNVSSDEKLKTGIKPVEKASEIIERLIPIEYRFKLTNAELEAKSRGELSRGVNDTMYGFSAQQVKQTLEELGVTNQSVVELGEDNRYGLRTGQIIPLLVADNQSLRKELRDMKGALLMNRELIVAIYNVIIDDIRKDPNLNEIKTAHIEKVVEAYENLTASDKVNINTADLDTLTTLEGIGETRAQAIIDYREAHGAFTAPEDLMQVPGIGESLYNEIQGQIKV